MAATVFVYAYFKELREEKSFLCFAVSLLVVYATYPFVRTEAFHLRHIAPFLLTPSMVMSVLWASVLSFDIWWRFKTFQKSTDNSKRFRFYCAFTLVVFVLFILSLFAMGARFIPEKLFISFLILFTIMIGILDVVFMLLAGFIIYKRSESDQDDPENTRFDMETKR